MQRFRKLNKLLVYLLGCHNFRNIISGIYYYDPHSVDPCAGIWHSYTWTFLNVTWKHIFLKINNSLLQSGVFHMVLVSMVIISFTCCRGFCLTEELSRGQRWPPEPTLQNKARSLEVWRCAMRAHKIMFFANGFLKCLFV